MATETNADVLNGGTPVEGSESDFAGVPVNDFLSKKKIDYPVFVKMKDGRFLKVAHTGDDLEADRLDGFRKSGIEVLWLKREDFTKYVELSKKVAAAASLSPAISADKKVELIRRACSVAHENLKIMGLSEGSLKGAEETFELSLSTIGSGPAAIRLLESVGSQGHSLYAHSAVCGMLCALLSKIMGWSAKKNITALVMTGFLHDLGLSEVRKELHTKDHAEMTPEELVEYRKHPEITARLLSQVPSIPSDVISCAMQHHEDVRGTGYPRRLTRTEIMPMSRIIFLVDQFCDLILRVDPEKRKKSPQILELMLEKNRGVFDLNSARALAIALTEPDLSKARVAYSRQQNQK